MSFGDSSEASKLLEAALLQMDGIIQVRPPQFTTVSVLHIVFAYHVLHSWINACSGVLLYFILQALFHHVSSYKVV